MSRVAFSAIAAATLVAAAPASAITNDHGVVVFTQADALAGGVTAGDTPGFPVTISVAGSYRLGSNLTVTTAVNGIEVRANEVTVDMGGFTLAGSGAGRNGITSFNRATRLHSGNVRGFINDGIRSIAQFLTVTNMIVTANGRHGVAADADGTPETVSYASVAQSKITKNGSNGVRCTFGCQVSDSVIAENGASGIFFYGQGGLALGNVLMSNGSFGYTSIPTAVLATTPLSTTTACLLAVITFRCSPTPALLPARRHPDRQLRRGRPDAGAVTGISAPAAAISNARLAAMAFRWPCCPCVARSSARGSAHWWLMHTNAAQCLRSGVPAAVIKSALAIAA